MSIKCPVVLNFFNRKDTTLRVFSSIRDAEPTKLYLISDGGRTEEEQNKINELRSEIESRVDWKCDLTKVYADSNMGCRDRIVSGYNLVFEKEQKAILLEDDTLPIKSFFRYMEEMLERFSGCEDILQVTGNNLNPSYEMSHSYEIVKFGSTWGWGTWSRAWKLYDGSYENWEYIKKNRIIYNYYGEIASSLEKDYEKGFSGKINTWDFQWWSNVMKHGGMQIVPKVNMIENIGFYRDDGTHTNCESVYDFRTEELDFPLIHPMYVKGQVSDPEWDKEFLKTGL